MTSPVLAIGVETSGKEQGNGKLLNQSNFCTTLCPHGHGVGVETRSVNEGKVLFLSIGECAMGDATYGTFAIATAAIACFWISWTAIPDRRKRRSLNACYEDNISENKLSIITWKVRKIGTARKRVQETKAQVRYRRGGLSVHTGARMQNERQWRRAQARSDQTAKQTAQT